MIPLWIIFFSRNCGRRDGRVGSLRHRSPQRSPLRHRGSSGWRLVWAQSPCWWKQWQRWISSGLVSVQGGPWVTNCENADKKRPFLWRKQRNKPDCRERPLPALSADVDPCAACCAYWRLLHQRRGDARRREPTGERATSLIGIAGLRHTTLWNISIPLLARSTLILAPTR